MQNEGSKLAFFSAFLRGRSFACAGNERLLIAEDARKAQSLLRRSVAVSLLHADFRFLEFRLLQVDHWTHCPWRLF